MRWDFQRKTITTIPVGRERRCPPRASELYRVEGKELAENWPERWTGIAKQWSCH